MFKKMNEVQFMCHFVDGLYTLLNVRRDKV